MLPNRPFAGLDTSTLVRRFRAAAVRRGVALENRDPEIANGEFDVIEQLADELTTRDALVFLEPLLYDSEPGARLSAAVKLLDVLPTRAEAVLVELAATKTMVGASADGTLIVRTRHGSR